MKEKEWAELFGSEWKRIKQHGSAIVDPDKKRVFWGTIKEMKRLDPHWSFEKMQPTKRSATERARDACIDFVKSLRRGSGGAA